jgi:hypothetical protein
MKYFKRNNIDIIDPIFAKRSLACGYSYIALFYVPAMTTYINT